MAYKPTSVEEAAAALSNDHLAILLASEYSLSRKYIPAKAPQNLRGEGRLALIQ